MALQKVSTKFTIALRLVQVILLMVNLWSHGCQGTPTDTSVLLGWKTQIQDPEAHLSNWVDSPSAPCSWAGIACDGYSFQVIHIDLSNMSLSGTIAPIMEQLQTLESFNLANDNFSGNLPATICSWVNLQYLALRNNSFAGTPPACLSQVKRLVVLDLSYNSFDSLPAQIGLFRRLSYLNVEGNALVGSIPPDIGDVTTLVSLKLGGNYLTGSIPSQLGQLRRLQVMHLGYNRLGGDIPLELGQLISLKYLNLAANNLTASIPSTLGNLPHLEEVKLFGNYLQGTIPVEIGNALGLRVFDISANFLRGNIPEEIGNLQSLTELNLSMNGLVGQVPVTLASLPRLQVFSLSQNQLTGAIPQELGVHSGISTLDLSSNFLVGPIPPNLCSSGELAVLMLASNFLSGSIPIDLQVCPSLRRLSLAKNALFGTLPEGIGELPLLKFLDLSWTGLTGTLEGAQFGDTSISLEELYLQGNQFTSGLPGSVGLILNLGKLDLSHNIFSGQIPPQLGNCTRLSELLLGQNNFSGSIPSEISNSKELQTMDLSWNALTGSIPAQIGSLLSLNNLDLSNNQLNGTIPIALANLSSLDVLNLSRNNLSGPVPVNGVFQTVMNTSLAENPQLCGGPARFVLPPCGSDNLSKRMMLVTGILVGLSVILFASAVWWANMPFVNFRHLRRGEDADPPVGSGQAAAAASYRASESGSGPIGDRREFEVPIYREPGLDSPRNREVVESDEMTLFNHGSVDSVRIEEYEAVLAPQNSPASVASLKEWQPAYWPWKLSFLVSDFDLTEAEVVQTCTPRNLMCRDRSAEMYSGVTKNGHHFVVEKPASSRVGKGKNLPNVLRKLGQFRHPCLVKMLGYCLGSDNSLVAILYEDLEGGNLHTALESGKLSKCPHRWGARFDIALGVVRALHYLHDHQPAYAAPLHAPITSANILLDLGFKPYLSVRVDVSELHPPTRPGPSEKSSGPYYERMLSTCCRDGTDIYNLGVLLLELLSGRQVVSPTGVHIVRWLTEAFEVKATLMDMVDPAIRDINPSIDYEILNQIDSMFQLAARCVILKPEDRPSLEEVLKYLMKVGKSARGCPRPWKPDVGPSTSFAID